MTQPVRDVTMVLDVGKTRAKLSLIDAAGVALVQADCANASVPTPMGYMGLGVQPLQAWCLEAVGAWPAALRARVAAIITTTHGAAFCGIGPAEEGAPGANLSWQQGGLALAPVDYEWDGYGALRAEAASAPIPLDAFSETGSPDLPLGLNAGWQLRWLQTQHPSAWARVEQWMPYPQYWAWWFSGVASSERSSMGCHTHLWSIQQDDLSPWAKRLHLLDKLAPMQQANTRLGPIRAELAHRWGMAPDVQVLCGVHDSNACLARYQAVGPNLTLVSTGTWSVMMSPSGDCARLRADRDQLVNVSAQGGLVPTARFMAGREFAYLCQGADPALASLEVLDEVLAQEWWAVPGFADAGGAFAHVRGRLLKGWDPAVEVSMSAWRDQPAATRATVASLYTAQVTAWLVTTLGGKGPVIVEGPQAHNPVIMSALSSLLDGRKVMRSTDAMEGTARGAWRLAQSTELGVRGGTLSRSVRDAILVEAIDPVQGMCRERLLTLQTTWERAVACA